MNIITCTESLRKFLIVLRLTLLLTKPQLDHLASLIVSAVQGGFDGKMKNIPELSMRNSHRTSIGKFLSKSPWPTSLVMDKYQLYVLAQISLQARKTGYPVYAILDDTISEKTKPSSKALRPTEGCSFHHSHLRKKRVYGHQIVCVLLECGELKLPYYMELYDKVKQSKINMVRQIIEALPGFPTKVYVLGDSWYSACSVIKAAHSRGFEYIGALKANRVLYYEGGPRLGQKVNAYVKTLTEKDVRLVTVGNQKYWVHRVNGFIKRLPKTGVILLSWPENKLFEENATHVFYSTCNLSEEDILSTYTGRWTIEIFFRDNKMQLELDRYQVRGKQAIQRFLTIIMLAYAYCTSISSDDCRTLGIQRKHARNEIKQNLIAYVYEQACHGIPLSKISEELGIAV
jgi:transposase